MNIFKKLKTIKRKWIVIIVIVLVVLIPVGGAIRHKHKHDRVYGNSSEYQVYCNLLSLESADTTKISSDEAKAILPLFQKLSAADSETKVSVADSIYGQLTSQQCYSLLNGSDRNIGDKGHKSWGKGFSRGSDEAGIPINSLKNVVTKMLKDKTTVTP